MGGNSSSEFSMRFARSDSININAHAEIQKNNELLVRMVMAQSESAADERTATGVFSKICEIQLSAELHP